MNKKLNNKIALIFGVVLTVGFAGCEEEYFTESPTVPTKVIVNDDLHPRNIKNLYLNSDLLVQEAEIEGGPIKFGVKTNRPVATLNRFSTVFDTSFVSIFNKKHSTKYTTIDKKFLDFKKVNCNIQAQKGMSKDSFLIDFVNIDQIKIEDKAILPFNILVDEGEVKTSSNLGQMYALLNTDIRKVNLVVNAEILNNQIDSKIDFLPGKSFDLDIKSTIASSKDVTIDVVVDTELLKTYNEENETSYESFSSELYNLPVTSSVIKSGSKELEKPISIEFKNEDKILWGTEAVIPLRLKVSVGGEVVDDFSHSAIIKLQTRETSVIVTEDESQVGGTLINTEAATIEITNPSNTNYYSSSVSGLFTRSTVDGWLCDTPQGFIIDLGEAKNVKTLALMPDYKAYMSYSSMKTVIVKTSVDSENWDDLLEVELPKVDKSSENTITHYLRFKPKNARYIHVDFPDAYGFYVGMNFIGFYE
ncbi:DUF1735 domain-containing protein [Flavobacteriaceae bacterium]|nr:DUF1735 domain-containing protein [Flavobacteriaceae bacterium]